MGRREIPEKHTDSASAELFLQRLPLVVPHLLYLLISDDFIKNSFVNTVYFQASIIITDI